MSNTIIATATIAIAVIALASAVIYYLYSSQLGTVSEPQGNYHYVWTANNRTYDIRLIAANETAREHGLMNTTITNATLMLFIFPSRSNYPFWMYDTYSDLDMMWLNVTDGSGTVVYIAANATSCFDARNCAVYDPNALANYVVEAKAGFAARNNIGVGTKVTLERVSG